MTALAFAAWAVRTLKIRNRMSFAPVAGRTVTRMPACWIRSRSTRRSMSISRMVSGSFVASLPSRRRCRLLRDAARVGAPSRDLVAYLILSHHLPDQVVRLAGALREGSPAAPILIHHDPGGAPLDHRRIERLGGVRRVPSRPVRWGWASQLDALLGSLSWALAHVEFDWLAVLSGQDYPARPLESVERELAASDLDGYVQGELVSPPALTARTLDEFAARYFYRHRQIRPPGPRARRALERARPLLAIRDMPWGTVLGRRVAAPFDGARPCRRGQDWFTLSRRCVSLLDRARRDDPRLLDHYRHSLHPTESFPHTVLHAEPGLRLSGDPRRYSAWRVGSPHPAVLGMADLDAILASGADFARKLDARIDSALFDALDRASGIGRGRAL